MSTLAPLLSPEDSAHVEAPPRARGWVRRRVAGAASFVGWGFGLASLLVGLAVLASVPIGQFLALGYLLEACGRVARSGRFRDGFIGVRTAGKLGGAALGTLLLWLPLYVLSIQAEAAQIIDPGGKIAGQLNALLTGLAIWFALHVFAACMRGGRLRDFFRPLNVVWLVRRILRGGAYQEARDRLWETVVALRLPYFFWLGVRGFVGAFLWLVIPLSLLAQGHKNPAVGILGGILLGLVVLYLPFLQARFARDNRFRAYRELRAVRTDFRMAPIAFLIALWVHLLFAVPLYLLKIEAIPRDLVFLEGLVFLLFMFPARLLGGWAYGRAGRRETPRHWLIRWGCRLLSLPAVVAYVLVAFVSLHIGWEGIVGVFNQHAFQLPVPFVTFGD